MPEHSQACTRIGTNPGQSTVLTPHPQPCPALDMLVSPEMHVNASPLAEPQLTHLSNQSYTRAQALHHRPITIHSSRRTGLVIPLTQARLLSFCHFGNHDKSSLNTHQHNPMLHSSGQTDETPGLTIKPLPRRCLRLACPLWCKCLTLSFASISAPLLINSSTMTVCPL